jgi:hypothetical protein
MALFIMANPKAAPLKDQIINLVKTVAEVQELWDSICDEDLDRCAAMLKAWGISPEHPLFETVLPTYLLMSSYQIDTGFLFSCNEETGTEIGFKLMGFPVHTFFEMRYGSTEQVKDRITINIERVPVWNPDLKPKED